jgi:hypothetical protein
MAEAWTITGPDGSVSDKATFLGLVVLTHLSRIATDPS